MKRPDVYKRQATTVEEARDTILAALGSQKKNGKKGAEVC